MNDSGHPCSVNRTALHVHLAMHLLVLGAAIGATLRFTAGTLPFAAVVALLVWLFTLLGYPAFVVWQESLNSQPTRLGRWVVTATCVAALIFFVAYAVRPSWRV
jgi:membrane protein DedA with SNARE-associated domain